MNIHVTVSDIRHDVSKIRGENGDRVHSVNVRHTQSIDNRRMLTVVQAQTRSVTSTTKGFNTLRLYPAYLESYLPLRQGHVSDVTS